jgi:hypothetical protein
MDYQPANKNLYFTIYIYEKYKMLFAWDRLAVDIICF